MFRMTNSAAYSSNRSDARADKEPFIFWRISSCQLCLHCDPRKQEPAMLGRYRGPLVAGNAGPSLALKEYQHPAEQWRLQMNNQDKDKMGGQQGQQGGQNQGGQQQQGNQPSRQGQNDQNQQSGGKNPGQQQQGNPGRGGSEQEPGRGGAGTGGVEQDR
jgi:hypothetical protein